MSNLTSTLNIPLSTKAEIDATIYLDPEANLVFTSTARVTTLKDGMGDTKRFPKYSLADSFETPIEETELDIDPQQLTKTFIEAEIKYYGTYFLIAERVVMQNPEDVLRVHAKSLNYALRKTEDILTRDVLDKSATSAPCIYGSNGDVPSQFSEKDFSTLIAQMAANQAKPISGVVSASSKFGTAPVSQAFMSIIHPDLIPDLMSLDNFTKTVEYGSNYKPMEAEWGAYDRIRFVQTTQALKEAAKSLLNKTVYTSPVLGRDAFTIIRQTSQNGKVVGPEKVGALDDKYKYGIKTSFAAAVLYDEHIFNVTCTRSTEL